MNYPLYNNTLCPAVWDQTGEDYQLKDDVRKALLTIAEDFIEKNLTENDLSLTIKDVVLIGSITNFNWTPYSDFDMHIIVDFAELDMSPEDAKVLVDGLKSAWNKEHAITIKGHPVELYIQDITEKAVSMSSYSVKNGEWIKKPVKQKPTFDKEFIKRKHSQIKSKLDDMLKNPSEEKLEEMLERIYDMRQAGLDKKGEFSEENIVFKILRSQGYLDRIRDAVRKVYDAERSLDEVEKLDDGMFADKDGSLIHTDDEPGGELVYTDDESSNRVWDFYGHPIFGAYRIDPRTVNALKHDGVPGKEISNDMTNLRHALKHPINADSKHAVKELAKKSVDRMFKQMDMKRVDVLLPLGSNSGLNLLVAKMIQEKIPNVQMFSDVVKKTRWRDVKLSAVWYKEVERSGGKPMEGTRRAQQVLANNQHTRPDDEFQIKHVPRGLRRYFGGFYHADPSKQNLESAIRGKRLLVIDDTLEEGSTFKEALRVLEQYQPAEIMGYIFLFGRGAGV